MPEKEYRMLIINPDQTSTKIGVYDNDLAIFEQTIRHEAEILETFANIIDQYEFRKRVILETLDNEGINISKLKAVCGRGGLLRPLEGGTYTVNEAMLKDLKAGSWGQHASNLGGILAYGIAFGLNIPSFIVDPVVIDELEPVARISGFPLIERKSIFHALSQKAAAHRAARELGKKYPEVNLIVVYLGAGITIGVHKNGRVIDVNNGLDGEGPFSPERAGTVPAGDLISLCYSGEYTKEELMRNLVVKGGLAGYLGTNNVNEAEMRIKSGDKRAALIYEAMAYQVAKEIAAAGSVLYGEVDGIVLTGRLACGEEFVKLITDRVNWIADVMVQPGENDLHALAEGTLRILRGEEEAKEYPGNLGMQKTQGILGGN